MNDKSKKMISLGIPEQIDLSKNIALGNPYEDVEYVKSPSKKETPEETIAKVLQPISMRMNKKADEAATEKASEKASDKAAEKSTDLHDTVTPEEHALEDLVAVEFDRDVTDPAQAFNNLMRH